MNGEFDDILRRAKGGDPHAQYKAGAAYEHGEGVAANATTAISWYRKAASRWHAHAAYRLGRLLIENKKTEKEGVEWLRLAADARHVKAALFLADLYETGRVVGASPALAGMYRSAATIREEDATWHDKLRRAEEGNAHRSLSVARDLATGEQAIKWYLRGAESDDADVRRQAYTELGELYGGRRGFKRDPQLEKHYLQLAAAAGSSEAKAQLEAIAARAALQQLSTVGRIRLRITRLGPQKSIVLLLIALVTAFVYMRRADSGVYAAPAAVGLPGLELEHVLTPADVQGRGWHGVEKLQITANDTLLLRAGPMIYEAISGLPMLMANMPDLKDYCVVGNRLIAIRGDRLSYYEEGDLKQHVQLPSDNMRLVAGVQTEAVFLYGNSAGAGDIYAVFPGGRYGRLVHVDQPILSVAAAGERLFLSTSRGKVLTWKEGEAPSVIVDIGEAPITSLAFDAVHRYLYFTSGEGVFAVRDSSVFLALAGVSGDLLFVHDTLFISDTAQDAVVAVRGLTDAVRNHAS